MTAHGYLAYEGKHQGSYLIRHLYIQREDEAPLSVDHMWIQLGSIGRQFLRQKVIITGEVTYYQRIDGSYSYTIIPTQIERAGGTKETV